MVNRATHETIISEYGDMVFGVLSSPDRMSILVLFAKIDRHGWLTPYLICIWYAGWCCALLKRHNAHSYVWRCKWCMSFPLSLSLPQSFSHSMEVAHIQIHSLNHRSEFDSFIISSTIHLILSLIILRTTPFIWSNTFVWRKFDPVCSSTNGRRWLWTLKMVDTISIRQYSILLVYRHRGHGHLRMEIYNTHAYRLRMHVDGWFGVRLCR